MSNKSNKEEYELILFLYFDVLSPENKKKYTNENFKSNIDIYKEIIEKIKNDEFPKEHYSRNLDNRIILLEKKIIKIFPKITELIEKEKTFEKKEFIDKIQEDNNNKLIKRLKKQIKNEIDNILIKRINSKISLSNIEIFFQDLIKIYIDAFLNKKETKLELIQTNIITIYKIIIDSIDQIKKNKLHKYSSDEEKFYLLVFMAPIIGDNLKEFYNFSQRSLDVKDENFNFINDNNKLIVNYKGNNNKLYFPDYFAIN